MYRYTKIGRPLLGPWLKAWQWSLFHCDSFYSFYITRNQTVSSFLEGNEFFVINTKLVFHNGSEIAYIIGICNTWVFLFDSKKKCNIYPWQKHSSWSPCVTRLSRIGFIGSIQSVMRSFSMGSIQSIMTSFHFQLGLSSLLWDQFHIQLGLSSLLWVQLIFQLGLSRLLWDQLMNWTHNQLDGPYKKWSQIDIPQVGSSKGTKSDCLDSIFCNNCSPTNSKLSFHVSRRSLWTAVSIFLELTYSNAVSSSEKKMVWVTLDCSQAMVTLHGAYDFKRPPCASLFNSLTEVFSQ
jgi:hypothetical protein